VLARPKTIKSGLTTHSNRRVLYNTVTPPDECRARHSTRGRGGHQTGGRRGEGAHAIPAALVHMCVTALHYSSPAQASTLRCLYSRSLSSAGVHVLWDARVFVEKGFHEYKGRFRTCRSVSARGGGAGCGRGGRLAWRHEKVASSFLPQNDLRRAPTRRAVRHSQNGALNERSELLVINPSPSYEYGEQDADASVAALFCPATSV